MMLMGLSRIWQVLWGLPQNVAGAVIYAYLFRSCHHHTYRSAFVTEWPLGAGLSLGMFIFVPRHCPRSLLAHEYGHTLQSLLLGPLYVVAIVVPSLVWAGTPSLRRYRSSHGYSYYRFYCERWANLLAMRVTGVVPEGWYPRKRRLKGDPKETETTERAAKAPTVSAAKVARAVVVAPPAPMAGDHIPVSTTDARIRAVLAAHGFRRPDPGPASPGAFDHGASYRQTYTEEIGGEPVRVRVRLFDLGCVTSEGYDGSRDEVCIDLRTGEPWYVVAQQNGGIADFCIYGGRPASFALVRELARVVGAEAFCDLDADNWREHLSAEDRALAARLS